MDDNEFYYKLSRAFSPPVKYRTVVEDGVTIVTPYIEWKEIGDGEEEGNNN